MSNLPNPLSAQVVTAKLTALMEARQKLTLLKQARELAYAAWLESTSPLRAEIVFVADRVADQEAQIKVDALAEYEVNHNKAPYPGVQIKEMTRLEYDETQALDWAKKTGLALLLDKKGFERISLATPLEFVKILKIPQVQIAAELEKIFAGEGK